MMKGATRNLIVYIVPYLLICSSIYQITYWNQFGFNGLEIVSLEDIIKTSILPIAKTFLESFLISILLLISIRPIKRTNVEKSSKEESKTVESISLEEKLKEKRDESFRAGFTYRIVKTASGFNPRFLVILLMFIAIPLIIENEFPAKWYLLFFIIMLPTVWLLYSTLENGNLKKKYKQNLTTYLFIFLALPVLSFISGMSEAEKVRKAYDYNYIVYDISNSNEPKKEILKLVGFSDNLSIYIDMKNKNKYFLETEKVGPLRHKYKGSVSHFFNERPH